MIGNLRSGTDWLDHKTVVRGCLFNLNKIEIFDEPFLFFFGGWGGCGVLLRPEL
jgi:hypothetical protein